VTGEKPVTAITSLTATEIAQKIIKGEISAREAVDAHIHRIEQVNTRLNAVVIPLFDQARREADAADTAQRHGDLLGPLHGVPVTIKEQFLVKDTATTFGVFNLRNHKATGDGPLVTRLRKAGAIILGKTNTSQMLWYIESDNPVYGRTNNPWNLERSPGGSSGGEAAIIASGGSPLGLGADFAGSIREPSHFCGIQGLKPTARRLTNFDTRPGVFASGQEGVIPQPGPMARSVADLALAMSILAAPGLGRIDPSVPPVPWPTLDNVSVRGMRIAMYTDDGYFSASPAIRRLVKEASDALSASGAEVETWMPPDVNEAMRLFFGIVSADAASALRRALGPDEPMPQIRSILQGSSIPRPLRRSVALIMQILGQARISRLVQQTGARSTEAYWKLIEDLLIYRVRFLNALNSGRFDAIICPPTSLPAPLHGSTTTLLNFDSYSRLYNLLGMPAGVVAAGCVRSGEESSRTPSKDRMERTAAEVEKKSAGLPVGVQVAARHWREDIVLAVMSALENHFRTQADYPGQPPI
jgi:fatty acid amide hydrolase